MHKSAKANPVDTVKEATNKHVKSSKKLYYQDCGIQGKQQDINEATVW